MSMQTVLRKRPLSSLSFIGSASVLAYGFYLEKQADRRENAQKGDDGMLEARHFAVFNLFRSGCDGVLDTLLKLTRF